MSKSKNHDPLMAPIVVNIQVLHALALGSAVRMGTSRWSRIVEVPSTIEEIWRTADLISDAFLMPWLALAELALGGAPEGKQPPEILSATAHRVLQLIAPAEVRQAYESLQSKADDGKHGEQGG